MDTLTSLLKLEDNIHTALKMWHEASNQTSPLDYLQLFHRSRNKGTDNARQVTNEILFEALRVLAVEHQGEAELLRKRFLDGLVMHAVANQLNMGLSTAYRKQKEAIRQLALIIQEREYQARSEYQTSLEKRLKLPPETPLFGFDNHVDVLQKVIVSSKTCWLVSIEGLGGLGKTALATALVRHPELSYQFYDVIWVSAKQQDYLPGIGLEQKTSPALTREALTDTLLNELNADSSPAKSPQEKYTLLTKLLKQDAYLIVIDNLETAADYQNLLPLLRELATPTKFLLTSRHSLRSYPDVYCHSLTELDPEMTQCFIRHEASIRGLSLLTNASDAELKPIYEVVGGNPLALKLVVGQISVLPLSQVLGSLKEARGKTIDELYNFIYWQAWDMLDLVSQRVFLMMPLAQDGEVEQLLALTQLDIDTLGEALQHLARLSLIQVQGNLEERRYTIHRLTETFLLNEAIRWNIAA